MNNIYKLKAKSRRLNAIPYSIFKIQNLRLKSSSMLRATYYMLFAIAFNFHFSFFNYVNAQRTKSFIQADSIVANGTLTTGKGIIISDSLKLNFSSTTSSGSSTDSILTINTNNGYVRRVALSRLRDSLKNLNGWQVGGNPTGVADTIFGSINNTPLTFRTNDVERMRLSADGKIVIKASNTKGQWLVFSNSMPDSINSMNMSFGSAGVTSGVPYIWSSNGKFFIGPDNNPTLMINNKNIGIGIGGTLPSNTLHVKGTDPLRIEGLSKRDDITDSILVLDVSGVVRKSNEQPLLKRDTLSLSSRINSARDSSQWMGARGGNIYYNLGNVGIGVTSPVAQLHTTEILTNTGGNFTGNIWSGTSSLDGVQILSNGGIQCQRRSATNVNLAKPTGFTVGNYIDMYFNGNVIGSVAINGTNNGINFNGNTTTATSLLTSRNIALTGDVTGNANFDGSANSSITTTLSNSGVTAGTYKSVTVDTKGRVTAATNPTTLAGYGITDAWNLRGNTPNATNDFIGTTGAQDLVFRTNNTERMRITSVGAINIHTSNVGGRQVVFTNGTNSMNVSFGQTGGTNNIPYIFAPNGLFMGPDGTPTIWFDQAAGRVGIGGTTTPRSALDVGAGQLSAARLSLRFQGAGNEVNLFLSNTAGAGDNGTTFLNFWREATVASTSLNLLSGVITAPSDIRLKENIASVESGVLNKILKLSPTYFTYKRDSSKTPQVGFIAQEVEPLFPIMVNKPADDKGYYSLETAKLIPYLVKAIQEQQQQIEEMKKQISRLANEK